MVEALSKQAILEAAESVLRRYGPRKTTVVDVARELNVSHGSVYRHFESKSSLRQAVAERWLGTITAPLTKTARSDGGATEKLSLWLRQLAKIKRRNLKEEPELFEAFLQLAYESTGVVDRHVEHLISQIEAIVAQGVEEKAFHTEDVHLTARAVYNATLKFHHPSHGAEWQKGSYKKELDATISLVLSGLTQTAQ